MVGSERCQRYVGYPNYAKYGCGDMQFRRWIGQIPHRDPGPHPGVALESNRTFWLESFPKEVVSKHPVNKFLKSLSIQLCPHMSHADWAVPERVLLALDAAREITAVDPLKIHRLEQMLKSKKSCNKCYTTFKFSLNGHTKQFRVKSVRFLGKARSAKDPTWLCQRIVSNSCPIASLSLHNADVYYPLGVLDPRSRKAV